MSGHWLIVGQSESGKTTLARRLAAQYRARGIRVIVLDPLRAHWDCDHLFARPAAFMGYVRNRDLCESCALFIDEAPAVLSRYDADARWLTTMARHHGHRTHLLSQRAEAVDRTLRSQCGTLAAFRLAAPDAKAYARDFSAPELEACDTLAQGEYFLAQRFRPTRRLRLW